MKPHTIKIKPSHPSQGDHVVINAEEFDAEKHQKVEQDEPKRRSRKTEQETKE
jgi:hypothetical protein